MVSGDLNSDSHACKASTLPTEPSYQPFIVRVCQPFIYYISEGQNGTMSYCGSPGHLMFLTNKVQTRHLLASRLCPPPCLQRAFPPPRKLPHFFPFMPGPSEFSPRRCWGQGRVLTSEVAAHWSGRLLLSSSQRHGFFQRVRHWGKTKGFFKLFLG